MSDVDGVLDLLDADMAALRAAAEWERQKGVIAALLPYSGANRARILARRWPRGLVVEIPHQRRPLPTEAALVERALRAQRERRGR